MKCPEVEGGKAGKGLEYIQSMRDMKNTLLLLFALLGYSGLLGQEDSTRWTAEDIINLESMSDVVLSPNNQMVAWTKGRPCKEKDKFLKDIYLTRLELKKDGIFRTFQLTSQDEDDSNPFFSRDSETLYFLSTRDKGKKLWAMSVYGGEPKEVHEFQETIADIQWLSDSTFAFTASEGKTLYAKEKEAAKDDVEVVEDTAHWEEKRIFSFHLEDKRIERLTDNNTPVSSYRVSHKGQWLVYGLTMSPHYEVDAQPAPRYFLKNLKNGNVQEILKGLQTPGSFQFTADDSGFYFTAVRSSDPKWNGAGITELYYFSLIDKGYTKVDLQWDWGIGREYFVIGQGVIAALANGATDKLAFYHKNGNRWEKSDVKLGGKEAHSIITAVSEDYSKAVYQHSTAGQLPRYYLASLAVENGQLQFRNEAELARLNQNQKKKNFARYEVARWKGYNGEEVDGLLYYPEHYEAGRRYPLMLSIHGGPMGVDRDLWDEHWASYPQILSQRGAFVLLPNYHGSSNHGLAFEESIKGHYYDLEMEDITKGIQALFERGLIDTTQMGVMGWSNGAILTTMLTVRYPEKFKVACPGAGDVNWTSDYGTCEFGVSFDQSYFRGAPWDDRDGKTYNEAYIQKSPLFELEKVKTPTIIFHGSEDRAVPRDQGHEYYRAMQQSAQAPVRFLWFPGQPHELGKITHQLRKMKEELAWIDRYLFGKESQENAAFKADSPLALLLKKDSLSAQQGLYGLQHNGKLIPEAAVVAKDSISVGRFEVTNAQFAAFDPGFSFPAGQGNYPAQVSLDQAKRYVLWLSAHTGQPYRLPNTREARAFHHEAHQAGPMENTLNYWAGHTLTVDEVPLLRQKMEGRNLSLVKEAGQFAPIKLGAAEIFDLGGNLAEYCEDGNTYGYSAYDYVDPKSEQPPRSENTAGFRVILEAGAITDGQKN